MSLLVIIEGDPLNTLGFKTLHFLQPGVGGPSKGYSLSYVNSGFTVAHIVAPSTSEPNSAQRAPPNGAAPVMKFTAP